MATLSVPRLVSPVDTRGLVQLGDSIREGMANTRLNEIMSRYDATDPTSRTRTIQELYASGPEGRNFADRIFSNDESYFGRAEKDRQYGLSTRRQGQIETEQNRRFGLDVRRQDTREGFEVEDRATAAENARHQRSLDEIKHRQAEADRQQALIDAEAARRKAADDAAKKARGEGIFLREANEDRAAAGKPPLPDYPPPTPAGPPPPAAAPYPSYQPPQRYIPPGARPPAVPGAGPRSQLPGAGQTVAGIGGIPVALGGAAQDTLADIPSSPAAAARGPAATATVSPLASQPYPPGAYRVAGPPTAAGPPSGPVVAEQGTIDIRPRAPEDFRAQMQQLERAIKSDTSLMTQAEKGSSDESFLKARINFNEGRLKNLQEREKQFTEAGLSRTGKQVEKQLEAQAQMGERVSKDSERIRKFGITLESMKTIAEQPGYRGGRYANWALYAGEAVGYLNELAKIAGAGFTDEQLKGMTNNYSIFLRQADSLSRDLIRERAGGSLGGRFTESDLKFEQTANLGITQDPESMLRIINYHLAVNKRHEELNEIARQGLDGNPPKTVQQIEREQKAYSDANPLFARYVRGEDGKKVLEYTELGKMIAGQGPRLRHDEEGGLSKALGAVGEKIKGIGGSIMERGARVMKEQERAAPAPSAAPSRSEIEAEARRRGLIP